MFRRFSMLLACMALAACGDDNGGVSSVSAKPPKPPVTCPPGQAPNNGGQCKPVPQPPVNCPDGTTLPAGSTCPTPPPPPVTCADGTTVPAGSTCPPPSPVTQTCWDGTVIPASDTCPVKPEPVQCPDGSTVPQGQQCPVVNPPPQEVTWVPAQLKNGGYARIVKVEVTPYSELNVLPHAPAAVGSVWYVIPGAWGHTAEINVNVQNPQTGQWESQTLIPGRYVQALAPLDKVNTPFAGFYVFTDNIEGVAPAVPAGSVLPGSALAAQALQVVNTDDSYLATGIRECISLNADGTVPGDARSHVHVGVRYRVSVRAAGTSNQHSPVLLVIALPVDSPASGTALVPHYCLTPRP